ncbi:MAG: FAD-binding protein [Desulfobacteraceae bacterium]|nr:FAD-binding protein [Desulfobacteraceae bacterium]
MKISLQIVETDILVIGSGIAGLEAALSVIKSGRRPLLVSKAPMGKANNTILAGGAFTCATDDFSVAAHIEKTLESGCRLNNKLLVEQFVKRAPDKIKNLRKMGLPGKSHQTGFHCRVSSLLGGPDICAVLVRACRKAGVQFLENMVVTDLIIHGGRCRGAVGFNKRTGESYGLESKAVLLATGGAGAVYQQNDNAPGAMGDGYLLALEAGLELMDMEFVQFYPLVYAGSGRGHMIIPAVFGDIGDIVNRQGEDLKKKYELYEKPVAIVSRDRLSQALFKELILGNDVDGALLLDMRKADDSQHLFSEDLKARFKKKISYDTEPVKIIPACHHTMGGVSVDMKCRTEIKGLFAAGEIVGGIHGANRMGGNALCEAMVFGEQAGISASRYVGNGRSFNGFEKLAEMYAEKRFNSGDSANRDVATLMRNLKKTLWKDVGIVRSRISLETGIAQIDAILSNLKNAGGDSPLERCRLFECKSAAIAGKAIALSALERTESRGAQYREDHPGEQSGWLKHIHVQMKDQDIHISRIEPVR